MGTIYGYRQLLVITCNFRA